MLVYYYMLAQLTRTKIKPNLNALFLIFICHTQFDRRRFPQNIVFIILIHLNIL